MFIPLANQQVHDASKPTLHLKGIAQLVTPFWVALVLKHHPTRYNKMDDGD